MATAPEYAAPAETPFTAGPDRRMGARSYAVPFIVAVTGHRDLAVSYTHLTLPTNREV